MALRPGQYQHTAKINGIAVGYARSGNPQVAVLFEVTDEGQNLGMTVTWFGSLHGGALAITDESLRACGWEGDDLAELPDLAAAGKLGPVQLVLEDEARESDGRVFPTVVFINRLGGGAFQFKPESLITGGDLKALGARMKATFAATRSRPAAAPPKTAAPTGQSKTTAPAGNAGKGAGAGARSTGGARAAGARRVEPSQGHAEENVPPPSDNDLPYD
jgi:hypothetical protein